MKVVVLCEGATEEALKNGLREFVQSRASATRRIGVATRSLDGPVMRKKLARIADLLLAHGDVAGVIALSDVYPDFKTAQETKTSLRTCAGEAGKNPLFRAHAAQFEVEAWIIPSWAEIAARLRLDASPPGSDPERINSQKPPSHHLKELYARAHQRYEKPVDGPKWLTADRLERAPGLCPELSMFLNSMLEFAGGQPLA